MPVNREIKFMVDRTGLPDALRDQFSFDDEKIVRQEDIYSLSTSWLFKLRINDGVPIKTLRYRRLTSPTVRKSEYQARDLGFGSDREIAKYIFDNIPSAGVVRKMRRQFSCESFLLNIDTVYDDDWQSILYTVAEVEVFERAGQDDRLVEDVLRCFNVKQFQLLPYSNIHMVNMIKRSREAHETVDLRKSGRLILIDGGSGTGKSTVKDILVSVYQLGYARRETTRTSRHDDLVTGDYRFVSMEKFGRRALQGGYLEFRDFLFGMSYGLPWDEFVGPLSEGEHMMALINLGNGFFTKKLFPSATLVLLHADQEVIQRRLSARGGLTIDQMAERLENNRLAQSYIEAYDLAIDTGRCSAQEVAEMIARR